MVPQQCFPGRALPRPCQLPSHEEWSNRECWPIFFFFFIKWLQTWAFQVTRKELHWFGGPVSFRAHVSAKGIHLLADAPCKDICTTWTCSHFVIFHSKSTVYNGTTVCLRIFVWNVEPNYLRTIICGHFRAFLNNLKENAAREAQRHHAAWRTIDWHLRNSQSRTTIHFPEHRLAEIRCIVDVSICSDGFHY